MNATEVANTLDALGIDYSTEDDDGVVTFQIAEQAIEFVS